MTALCSHGTAQLLFHIEYQITGYPDRSTPVPYRPSMLYVHCRGHDVLSADSPLATLDAPRARLSINYLQCRGPVIKKDGTVGLKSVMEYWYSLADPDVPDWARALVGEALATVQAVPISRDDHPRVRRLTHLRR
jgi:hypothetical protein